MRTRTSDSALNDRIQAYWPSPLAILWRRVTSAHDDATRTSELVGFNTMLLRCLCAVVLPDYLQTPDRNSELDRQLQLKSPLSDGNLLKMLELAATCNASRPEHVSFTAGISHWLAQPVGDSSRTDFWRRQVIAVRNEWAHGGAAPTTRIAADRADALQNGLRTVLEGLTWFDEIRLIRVVRAEPVGTGKFRGHWQHLHGSHATLGVTACTWDGTLRNEDVYIYDAKQRRALCLAPFVQVVTAAGARQEDVAVFGGSRSGKSLKLVTATGESKDERDQSTNYKKWLAQAHGGGHAVPLHIQNAATGHQQATDSASQTTQRYRLGNELGRGGMAIVYAAIDTRTHQEVAVKMLSRQSAADPRIVARFQREGNILSRIEHPNLVAVHEEITLPDGRIGLVMSRAQGSVADHIQHGTIHPAVATKWLAQAADALRTLHAAGIVHRDVKPSNLLLDEHGDILVADVGIAQVTSESPLTLTGERMGSVAYMAPEQQRRGEVTASSDGYSLALVGHRMLCGQLPTGQPGVNVAEPLGGILRSLGEYEPQRRATLTEARDRLLDAQLSLQRSAEAPGTRDGSVAPWTPSNAIHATAVEAAPLDPTLIEGPATGPGHTPVNAAPHTPAPPALSPRRGGLGLRRGLPVALLLAAGGVGAFVVLGGPSSGEDDRAEAIVDGDAVPETERVEEVSDDVAGVRDAAAAIQPDFVLVQPGTFMMGSNNDEVGRDDDEHLHAVAIEHGFYADVTETTQAQWESVMGSNPAYFTDCGGDCPVERVSWYDAIAYANARSVQAGLRPCYELDSCEGRPGLGCGANEHCSGNEGTSRYACAGVRYNGPTCEGYRLPTEAEWEYMARAGTTTPWSCGTDPGCVQEIGWYEVNAGEWAAEPGTRPVGLLAPNSWGLYDTTGNVYEWVWDAELAYPADGTDPTQGQGSINDDEDADRVLRGCSWSYDFYRCRSANRQGRGPTGRSQNRGFRLVRTMMDEP